MQPPSILSARISFKALERSMLYSLAARVWLGATTIESPVWIPTGSTFSIEQIAIESEGKEPSAKYIATIIEKAKAKGVRTLFYQVEYPRSVVEVVAKDMGIAPKEINPLSGNPVEFIRDVTNAITGNKQ